MIVTCVYIHVKPETVVRFIEATTANHIESCKEPGNLRFDLVRQSDDACRFMLYEAYETGEAAVRHKTTPHYLIWRDTVEPFMAEPRKGVRYDIIEPDDPLKW